MTRPHGPGQRDVRLRNSRARPILGVDVVGVLGAAATETLLGEHGRRVSRGFTGHGHLDRTGLVHMNGRVHDPRLGRFLSPDPIVADPTSSQSWNLYSYVGNNPLSRTDPSGLKFAPGCGGLIPCDVGGGFTVPGASLLQTITTWRARLTVTGALGTAGLQLGPISGGWGVGAVFYGERAELFGWEPIQDWGWSVEFDTVQYPVYQTFEIATTLVEEQHPADEPVPKSDSEIFREMLERGEISAEEYWMNVDPPLDSVFDPVELLMPPYGSGGALKLLRNPKAWRSLFLRPGHIAESVRLGKIGEAALNRTGGKPQVRLRTSLGPRVVDKVRNRIGREAKVGRVALTSRIRGQIAKDAELLRTQMSKGYEWHFYRGRTGIGPTAPLRDALDNAGIKIVEY